MSYRVLVRRGKALCPEGEEILRAAVAAAVPAEEPKIYPKAYWRCGHPAHVIKPVWPTVVMLVDVGLEKRQRRRIVGVKLCAECWERVKDRWQSVKENPPADWRRLAG